MIKRASALTAALLVSVAMLATAEQDRASAEPPTFTRDVAPIIYRNCSSCHRPGGPGPLRPGHSQVVHHALMRTDETRSSRLQAALDPEMGFANMNMGDAVQPWGAGPIGLSGRLVRARVDSDDISPNPGR